MSVRARAAAAAAAAATTPDPAPAALKRVRSDEAVGVSAAAAPDPPRFVSTPLGAMAWPASAVVLFDEADDPPAAAAAPPRRQRRGALRRWLEVVVAVQAEWAAADAESATAAAPQTAVAEWRWSAVDRDGSTWRRAEEEMDRRWRWDREAAALASARAVAAHPRARERYFPDLEREDRERFDYCSGVARARGRVWTAARALEAAIDVQAARRYCAAPPPFKPL